MKSHQSPIGETDDWLTPRWILDRLGEFDLDPCAPVDRPWDMAKHHFTISDDGLSKEWTGRVWLNPPFNRYERPKWIKRMAEHGNGIMLIPAALETYAFKDHVFGKCCGILALNRRPHYCYPDGREATFNSGATMVLVSYGDFNLQVLMSSGLGTVLVESAA